MFINHFGFSQFVIDSLAMDSLKEVEIVKPVEAGFLFSYYEQDGTKSPVTGGIGDEALQDRVQNVVLNIPISSKLEFNFFGGIDSYTSASTDYINNEYGLYTETSASRSDIRKYGSLGVLINNEKRRISYGGGLGVSYEYDVKSHNIFASFRKQTKNLNTVFFLKSSVYFDKWTLYYPDELRWKYNEIKERDEDEDDEDDDDDDGGGSAFRNSYNSEITIEQDISSRMNASLTTGITYQDGLLSTPFHRVYFIDSFSHDIEKLPSNRLKVPIGVRLNYYFNKFLISRLFYRYYFDDFGIKAHTANVELPIKLISSFTLSPFYRYHTQTATKYFKPFGYHSVNDQYYTSDYDLGDIKSHRLGFELRYSPFIKSNRVKKTLTFKKIALRTSKYFRLRQNELILKTYIFTVSLNFRIE